MCLAIPMKVIEINETAGKVEAGGVVYEADFSLLEEVNLDDYVLVHAGFAIERLDEEEARKTISLFKELSDQGVYFGAEREDDQSGAEGDRD